MDVTMFELDQMPLHMYMHTTSLSQIPVTAATNKFQGWQYYVGSFLKQQSQQLSRSFDIATVIDREQHSMIGLLSSIFMMIVTAASYCIGPCSLSTSMHMIFPKSSVFLIGGC